MAYWTDTYAQYLVDRGAFTSGESIVIQDSSAVLEGLTAGNLTGILTDAGSTGYNVTIDSTDDSISFTVDQYAAALPAGAPIISFDPSDFLALYDTGAHIQAMTTGLMDRMNTAGVQAISPSDGTLIFDVDHFNHLGTMAVDGLATFKIADTGTILSALSSTTVANMAAAGVDKIDATNNVLSLTVAQFNALGSIALTSADTVTLKDAGTTLALMGAGTIATLAGKGIDFLEANDVNLTLTFAEYSALGTVALRAANNVTVTGTSAELLSKTFASYSTKNVDTLSSSDAVTLNETQAAALVAATVVFDSANSVTLSDSGVNIAVLSSTDFGKLYAHGVDTIVAGGALGLTFAQYSALGSTVLTGTDTVTVTGTSAELLGVPFATFDTKLVDTLHASTDVSLSKNQAVALVAATVVFDVGSNVTLSDTGANIELLSATDIGKLHAHGVDAINASGDAYTLTGAKFNALNGVTLAVGDIITLTVAQGDISTVNITAWAGAHIDNLSAGTDPLSLTKAEYDVLGAMTLTGTADTLTVANQTEFDALTILTVGTKGFEHIYSAGALSVTVAQFGDLLGVTLTGTNDTLVVANDGAFDALTVANLHPAGIDHVYCAAALTLTKAQYDALSGVTLTGTNDTLVVADDTEFDTLTIANVHTAGIEHISCAGALTLTKAQYDALSGVTLTGTNDTLVVADDTEFDTLAIANVHTAGIEHISCAGALTLTKAQYDALNGVTLTGTNDTLVVANQTEFDALTIANVHTAGIEHISSAGALNVTVAQFGDLGGVTLTGTNDTLVVANDTAFDLLTIANLHPAGIDHVYCAGALTLTKAQYDALNGVTLTGTNDTLLVANADLAGLTFANLAPAGIEHLQGTDALTVTTAQYGALSSVDFTGANTVTVTGTSANIGKNFAAYAAKGVDILDETTSVTLAKSQTLDLLGTALIFSPASSVQVYDTGANIALLTNVQIGQLAGRGVDRLNANNDTLSLSFAQYSALGGVILTGADVVTVTGTSAELLGVGFATFDTKLVDVLHASNPVTLNAVQTTNLLAAACKFDVASDVTAQGTSAELGKNFAAYQAKGVDVLDASTSVTIGITQAGNLVNSTVNYSIGSSVLLYDTGLDIALLSDTQIGHLAAHGVDRIQASDGTLSLSFAQYSALGTVALTPGDTVTVTGTSAELLGVGTATFDAKYVDVLHATDAVTITEAQAATLVAGNVSFDVGSVVTLRDTRANIALLTFGQIGQLAGKGVDFIDSSTNVVELTVAEYQALGTVQLTAADENVLKDTGTNLALLTNVQIAALAGKRIDTIDSTTGNLTLSVAQFAALGSVALTAADTVTLSDNSTNLQALTLVEIGALAGKGIDRIDASDNALSLTLAQYQALGTVQTASNDVITVTGTASANAIVGTPYKDKLYGLDGNDTLTGGLGNDTLDGGTGVDTAVFTGNYSAYTVTRTSDTALTVVGEGTDKLTNIERLQFADRTITIGAVKDDTNRDGKSDILWQPTSGGAVKISAMNGATITSTGDVASYPGSSWTLIGSGDFNGDGRADLLWQNTSGQAKVWLLNGTSIQAGSGDVGINMGSDWKVIGSGDFDANGKSDILWQNTSTGQAQVWFMDGTSVLSGSGVLSPNLGTSWTAIGTGDFNADAKADILWQNTTTGALKIWEMNGSTITSSGDVAEVPAAGWTAAGIGDFNGDGKSDILLLNTTSNTFAVWFMNGSTRLSAGVATATNGTFIGTGDYNGDGTADILWQNTTTGAVSIYMNSGAGTSFTSFAVAGTPGAGWLAVTGP